MLIWRGYGIVVFPLACFGIGFARHVAHELQLPWLGLLVVLTASALIALVGYALSRPRASAPLARGAGHENRRSPRARQPWDGEQPRRSALHAGRSTEGPPAVHDFFFIPVIAWSPIVLLIGTFVVFKKIGA